MISNTSSTYCNRSHTDLTIDLKNKNVLWCCKSNIPEQEQVTFDINNLDYDFLFRHPLLKERNTAMDNDIQHHHCDGCWVAEKNSNGKSSFRISHVPRNNEHKLGFIEVVITQTCNMTCKYCDSKYSTKWAKLTGQEIVNVDQALLEKTCELLKEYYISELKTVPSLTFNIVGGEPMMNQNTDYFVENVIDFISKNKHFENQQVTLMITSNYNFDKKILHKYLDYVDTYSNIYFLHHVSNEAVGPRAEFIRTGLDYNKWIENLTDTFKKMQSQEKQTLSVAFGCAHNVLSFPYFEEFLREIQTVADETNLDKMVYFFPNVIRDPKFLDVCFLSNEFKQAAERMLKYFNDLNLEIVNKNEYAEHLHSLINELDRLPTADEYKLAYKTYTQSKQYFDYGILGTVAPHYPRILDEIRIKKT